MTLNTTSIHDLYAMLATVQTRVQCAAMRVSKHQALPESDPLRPARIRLAYMVLDQHRAAQRRLIQKIKEAEEAEAEGLRRFGLEPAAQSPAIRAALEAEVERRAGL